MSRPPPRAALRPLYLPSALAVVTVAVVAVKLSGVALALSGRLPPRSERELYAAFYELAPPLAWGFIVGLPAVAVAVAFARQWYRNEETLALTAAALLCALAFLVVGFVFTYQNGGFSTGTAMYGGGCMLAVGLATEGRSFRRR